jgi:hypothetical protein
MGTKSRESIYGSSIRASAERAAEARKQADQLACEAWNQRMLGYKGRAQPSPSLGDALNAGYHRRPAGRARSRKVGHMTLKSVAKSITNRCIGGDVP